MCVVVRTGASVWPSVGDYSCLPEQDFVLCKYYNYCYHHFDQHEQKKKSEKDPPKLVDSNKHVDTIKVWIRTLMPPFSLLFSFLYPSISISVYLNIYIYPKAAPAFLHFMRPVDALLS